MRPPTTEEAHDRRAYPAEARAGTSSRSSPNRTLAEAARLLSERKIGAVVVSDTFRPVFGILSERDIVRAVAARGTAALEEPVSDAA